MGSDHGDCLDSNTGWGTTMYDCMSVSDLIFSLFKKENYFFGENLSCFINFQANFESFSAVLRCFIRLFSVTLFFQKESISGLVCIHREGTNPNYDEDGSKDATCGRTRSAELKGKK